MLSNFIELTQKMVEAAKVLSKDEREAALKMAIERQNECLTEARKCLDNQDKHFKLICEYRAYIHIEGVLYSLDSI